MLGETEQDKYGNNVNELLARFGLGLRNDTVQDYEHCDGAPSWILGRALDGGARPRRRSARARAAPRAFTVRRRSDPATVRACWRARTRSASVPGAPLIVAGEHGHGRVVVLADSDLFGDDCIDELDHAALWLNLATGPRAGPAAAGAGPGAR